MIYILLAVLCSSSIALIFKYSETRNLNRYAVTSANYFIAFMVSLIMVITDKLYLLEEKFNINNFQEEVYQVIIRNEGIFSLNSSIAWSIIIGIIAGIFFFSSFIYYQYSVRKNGVGLAGAFAKLGILVPMTLSIILWREIPGKIQWLGIILSLASIIIVNISFENKIVNNIKINLVLLFLFGGIAEFSNKIFQKYALVEYKSLFLFFVFFTAFSISVYFTYKRKRDFTKNDILIGFAVGVPNLFSSFFLILALNNLKTSVVFPIFSAGTIVIISIAGAMIFKEKLTRKEITSIIMTIIALVLINIK